MPWILVIRTFDVGQGESSVIVADDAAGLHRVMLIDGGVANQGRVVNGYLDAIIGAGTPVDHIVVTHYDADHSGGIMSLLAADNLYAICDKVATVMAVHAGVGTRVQRIAGCAAAACAAFYGAYDLPPGGPNFAVQANIFAAAARLAVNAAATDAQAAARGVREAEEDVVLPYNPRLIPVTSVTKRRRVCADAAIAAVNAFAAGLNVQQVARDAIFNGLRTMITVNARFSTAGRFANTHLMDTGASPGLPATYVNLVNGQVLMSNSWIQAPGINRMRTTPALGSEVLWNSGPLAVAAPANAPMMYVMAHNSFIWNAPPAAVPIAFAINNNNDSYGLILRFNRFCFYTGGDLITAGEDLIADAVMAIGLPNPAGGAAFPVPHRIAAFKCGHHGANTCTSQHFIDTIAPRAALISCGINGFGHPDQALVNRLHAKLSLRFFYLTGCALTRANIPASQAPPGNQLTTVGNKSRVAGGLAIPPGNITLVINQAESVSTSLAMPLNMGDAALRRFHITYYDFDLPVPAYRTESIIF
jgi:beta-lactamase superfamily II metal-dependent hydrolase